MAVLDKKKISKKWEVYLSGNANKQKEKLPRNIRAALETLTKNIELEGPVRGNWPNYSKLGSKRHHCHLKGGNPTYVAVWEVIDRKIRIVEVIYAGTHEKAPY